MFKGLLVGLCPPAKSEETKRLRDPLEAIDRSSRIRMRRITLTDNLHKFYPVQLIGLESE